jgi:hypothetical protein
MNEEKVALLEIGKQLYLISCRDKEFADHVYDIFWPVFDECLTRHGKVVVDMRPRE